MSALSSGNIKCPIGNLILAINFQLKLFCATVGNAGIGSLKSLPTLFDMWLDHIMVKFEQNRMIRYIRNFELFDRNQGFFKAIFGDDLKPFWKMIL